MRAFAAARLGGLPVLCRGRREREPQPVRSGRLLLSPGGRLLAAPLLLLAGILVCAVLPARRARTSQLIAALAVALQAACLLSLLPVVLGGGGEVERRLGELVPQVGLILRANGPGVGAVLVASVAALVALLERERRPQERAALLLCLLGTAVAGLAGNGVLLFGGVELGNVGALLLTAAALPATARPAGVLAALGRRQGQAFGFQHLAALGLLVAVARLHDQFQTSDLNALPAQALGTGFACAWALTGVVRLLAGLGLPRHPTGGSAAWAGVAAVPTGWLVLRRLDELTGGTLPPLVAPLLVGVGAAVVVGFGLVALGRTGRPELCGRALCTAAAGLPIAAAGLGGNDGPALSAVGALALVLALACAPGFAPTRGTEARRFRRSAAACLAVAGGLPIGAGFAAAVGLADATAARGPRGLAAALGLGIGATLLAVATGRAVRRALDAPADPVPEALRLDVAVALGLALLAATFPGTVVGAVDRCLGLAGLRGIDPGAFRGPGGGWPGGYVTVAGAALLVAGWSALRLLESETRRPTWLRLAVVDPGLPAAGAAAVPPPGTVPMPVGPVLRDHLPAGATDSAGDSNVESVPAWLRRADRGLRGLAGAADRADRWLVTQPNLVTLAMGAVILLFVYR
ncbi:MAG: hypothetical protein ABR541_09210 [Candidatus Dormibacteria bacterium]